MVISEVIYSTATNTCPRCHKGKVFKNGNPYNLKDMFQMHNSCSECGVSYLREPGFFYGAMYVSYALMAGWFITWFVANLLWFHFDAFALALGITGGIVIISPVIFRWSRIIWLNFFIRYKRNALQEASYAAGKPSDQNKKQ